MNETALRIEIDPVIDRYLVAFWNDQHAIFRRCSDSQAAACRWNPVARRLEVAVRAWDPGFLTAVVAGLAKKSHELPRRPATVMFLASDADSQAALSELYKNHPIQRQLVLSVRHLSGTESGAVRMLDARDKPLLAGYEDEHQSVHRLFHYHCVARPSEDISAWGWFPQGNQLCGICFVHRVDPMPEILYIHTLPSHRGLGGGGQLLLEASRWVLAKASALYYVTADTNHAALTMCRRFSFEPHSDTVSLVVHYDDMVEGLDIDHTEFPACETP